MYKMRSRFGAGAAIAAFGGVMFLNGCSDGTASGAHNMSISLTTRSATASRSTGLSNDIVVGPANELVLKRIQLVIDRVELSPSDATVCTGDNGEGDGDVSGTENETSGDDCEDMASNPILVNVPVDDAVHTVISVPVAAGTYTRLEAKLGPLDASQIGALGAPSDMAGRSVRIEGTFKGTPFVFTSPLRSTLEFEFNPPLVVDNTNKNATVNIDVTKWFIGGGGSVIDPNSANPGGPNEELVANNIRNSFKAFEDDNLGGDDDHEVENSGSRNGGGDH